MMLQAESVVSSDRILVAVCSFEPGRNVYYLCYSGLQDLVR